MLGETASYLYAGRPGTSLSEARGQPLPSRLSNSQLFGRGMSASTLPASEQSTFSEDMLPMMPQTLSGRQRATTRPNVFDP